MRVGVSSEHDRVRSGSDWEGVNNLVKALVNDQPNWLSASASATEVRPSASATEFETHKVAAYENPPSTKIYLDSLPMGEGL